MGENGKIGGLELLRQKRNKRLIRKKVFHLKHLLESGIYWQRGILSCPNVFIYINFILHRPQHKNNIKKVCFLIQFNQVYR